MGQLFSDTAGWAAIAGFLLPLLNGVVIQPTWGRQTRRLTSYALAAVVGTITAASTGAFTGADGGPVTVLSGVVIVLVFSQVSYAKILHGPAKAVEEATSPSQPADDAQADDESEDDGGSPELEPDQEPEPEPERGKHAAPE